MNGLDQQAVACSQTNDTLARGGAGRRWVAWIALAIMISLGGPASVRAQSVQIQLGSAPHFRHGCYVIPHWGYCGWNRWGAWNGWGGWWGPQIVSVTYGDPLPVRQRGFSTIQTTEPAIYRVPAPISLTKPVLTEPGTTFGWRR